MQTVLSELHRAFGWKSRLSAALGGRYLVRKIHAEAKRLAEGWTYEPPTFYERNEAAKALDGDKDLVPAKPCRYVVPPPPPARAFATPGSEPEELPTCELEQVIA